jgi:hypothetical protein
VLAFFELRLGASRRRRQLVEHRLPLDNGIVKRGCLAVAPGDWLRVASSIASTVPRRAASSRVDSSTRGRLNAREVARSGAAGGA